LSVSLDVKGVVNVDESQKITVKSTSKITQIECLSCFHSLKLSGSARTYRGRY